MKVRQSEDLLGLSSVKKIQLVVGRAVSVTYL